MRHVIEVSIESVSETPGDCDVSSLLITRSEYGDLDEGSIINGRLVAQYSPDCSDEDDLIELPLAASSPLPESKDESDETL